MKLSTLSFGLIAILVISISLAGCTGSTTQPPAATPTAAAGAQATAAPQGAGTTSAAASTGAGIFGGLSYNWVEYKIAAGSGDQSMIIYYKYEKSGKCTMRFDDAQKVEGMPSEMDCSSIPGSTEENIDPNYVSSDAQVSCSALPETVTVPAGTFSATKCTITSEGNTATSWVVKDKFIVKLESGSGQNSVSMVLNAYA